MSFTTLSSAQLAELREKAMLLIGLTANDTAFHADAMTVYDDESENTSSATVQVRWNETDNTPELVTVGNSSGTTTYDLSDAGEDTLTELVASINAAGSGEIASLVYGDGDALSADLVTTASASMLGFANRQTLKIIDYARLDQVITSVYEAIETEVDRGLYSASYTERIWLDRDTRTVPLAQPEVTDLTFLGVSPIDALTVTYTGSDTRATVRVTDTAIIISSRAGGTTTAATLTFASNVSTSAMKTAIDAVSGWSATVREVMPSAWLIKIGAQNAKSTEVTVSGWEDYDGEYDVDFNTGHIVFGCNPYAWLSSTWNARGYIYAEYTAGFTTLPSDIEAVILAMTKSVWDEGQKDSSVIEEKLGDYSYKVGEATRGGAVAQFEPYKQTLAKYRRPSV